MIPRKTMEKLNSPAASGGRHRQIVEIAYSLSVNGFVPETIFYQLRPKYGPDVPDREIWDIIKWAEKRAFAENKTYSPTSRQRFNDRAQFRCGKIEPHRKKTPLESAERFLDGFSCSDVELFEASPVRLSGNYREDCLFVFEYLYSPQDKINVVTEFRAFPGKNGSLKANPIGKGITKSRNNWLDLFFRNNSPVESEAGAWLRINPTNGRGITDNDISDFRFVLLESDILPVEIQFSILGKLPIPISAILTSGGKSLHAWV